MEKRVLSLHAARRAVDGTVCKTDSAVSWTLVHAVAQMRGLSGPNRIIQTPIKTLFTSMHTEQTSRITDNSAIISAIADRCDSSLAFTDDEMDASSRKDP